MRLSVAIASVLYLLGGLQCILGQSATNSIYSDPDEIRLVDINGLTKVAQTTFSASEKVMICQRGKGFVSMVCQVDNNGRIKAIINVKLYQAARSLPVSTLNKLKESVHRNVVFHVPAVDRKSEMDRYRRPSLVIPLRAFCK
jgi:hypothetical protein